jgi:hypothetical protein
MKSFKVTLQVTEKQTMIIHTVASNKEKAINIIKQAEKCPDRAIINIQDAVCNSLLNDFNRN